MPIPPLDFYTLVSVRDTRRGHPPGSPRSYAYDPALVAAENVANGVAGSAQQNAGVAQGEILNWSGKSLVRSFWLPDPGRSFAGIAKESTARGFQALGSGVVPIELEVWVTGVHLLVTDNDGHVYKDGTAVFISQRSNTQGAILVTDVLSGSGQVRVGTVYLAASAVPDGSSPRPPASVVGDGVTRVPVLIDGFAVTP